MTHDEFLTKCAEHIQALINAKAASPSAEELKIALAPVVNTFAIIKPRAAPNGSSAPARAARAAAVRMLLAFEDQVLICMTAAGFTLGGERFDINANAHVLVYHRDDRIASIVLTWLAEIQNCHSEETMRAHARDLCAKAISEMDSAPELG